MLGREKYLFGPVPSRRLGRSLGVDVVPLKVCTLDCIYCQLGRSSNKTIKRESYVPVDAMLAELKGRLAGGTKADFITISGSGEPTLNAQLGQLIKGIKKITDVPVAVLTNGTLLTEPAVRADCCKADVVLPSLDAGDEQTFQKINRPHKDITLEKLIDGLCTFRREFAGRIWLEIFLIDGINTNEEQIRKIRSIIRRINPDKVQLNTAVRPTAQAGVKQVEHEGLLRIAQRLGDSVEVEVVAESSRLYPGKHIKTDSKAVLSMLKRRPCSLDDICCGLGLGREEVLEYVTHLQKQGAVDTEEKNGQVFFKAK